MGTTYGDSSKYVCFLCTAITTSGGVTSPASGADIIYFKCETYAPKRSFPIKPKQIIDGSSYTTSKGKKIRSCRLGKIQIIDDDTPSSGSNTESLNNKVNMIDSWTDLDGSPVYLVVYSNIDSKNISLSRNATGALDYMKGYPTEILTTPRGGDYQLSITFVESTLL